MTRLNDLHTILLSTASQRADGCLYPTPESVTATGSRLVKALKSLSERGLIEERPADDANARERTDGDLSFGLFITDAGRAAIGVDVANDVPGGPAETPATAPASAPRVTKTTLVLDLLRRAEGATLAELIAATGWLPHTTRAALTGLRKKGHGVERSKREDATCYRVAA